MVHVDVDTHTIRRISVEAGRDPRVVRGVLAGRRSTATSRAAVADALRRLGLNIQIPDPPAKERA
jgi:hypothetical protein